MSDRDLRDLERTAASGSWEAQLSLWRAQRRAGEKRDLVFPSPLKLKASSHLLEEWALAEYGSWEDYDLPEEGEIGTNSDGDSYNGIHPKVLAERWKTRVELRSLAEVNTALYSISSSTLDWHAPRASENLYNRIREAALATGLDQGDLYPEVRSWIHYLCGDVAASWRLLREETP